MKDKESQILREILDEIGAEADIGCFDGGNGFIYSKVVFPVSTNKEETTRYLIEAFEEKISFYRGEVEKLRNIL